MKTQLMLREDKSCPQTADIRVLLPDKTTLWIFPKTSTVHTVVRFSLCAGPPFWDLGRDS